MAKGRNSAENAGLKDLGARSTRQKPGLGPGIGCRNGQNVLRVTRWVQVAEEVGEAIGGRERDGAGAFALAHAIHAPQAHAQPGGLAACEGCDDRAGQAPPAALIEIGVAQFAPVAAAQANGKSYISVVHRPRLPARVGQGQGVRVGARPARMHSHDIA